MIIEGNNLRPSEGYKYITNGDVWSDWVILGKNDSVENWHDTNTEPPEPIEPKSEYEQGYDDSTYDSLEDEEVE